MALYKDANKAYRSYRKRMKGLKTNKKNSNVMTKAQFMKKNYPDKGRSVRSRSVEKGMKGAGLSYAEIEKMRQSSGL